MFQVKNILKNKTKIQNIEKSFKEKKFIMYIASDKGARFKKVMKLFSLLKIAIILILYCRVIFRAFYIYFSKF